MEKKLKAKELAQKMFNVYGNIEKRTAIECALIAVDELIDEHKTNGRLQSLAYWEEVKQEIKLL